MENEKYYHMKLCVIDDEALAVEGDICNKFYTSRNGQFQLNPKMKVMGDLIVKRKSSKTVIEISTGQEISLVILEVSKNKDASFIQHYQEGYIPVKEEATYITTLSGDSSSLAVVFGIAKMEGIPFMKDEEFKIKEATLEDVTFYLEYTKSALWQETLIDIVEGAEIRREKYQKMHKEAKSFERPFLLRSLRKK